jgi:hypothetical protein
MQKRSLILFYMIGIVFCGSSATIIALSAAQLPVEDKVLTLALASLASLGTLLVPLVKIER